MRNANAPEHDVVRIAAEALKRHDAATDADIVAATMDDYRAGGLGVAGPAETLTALELGQVDELYLTTAPAFTAGASEVPADEFVSRARQTSAHVRFIEDARLLEPVGGVAAALRFRADGPRSVGVADPTTSG